MSLSTKNTISFEIISTGDIKYKGKLLTAYIVKRVQLRRKVVLKKEEERRETRKKRNKTSVRQNRTE